MQRSHVTLSYFRHADAILVPEAIQPTLAKKIDMSDWCTQTNPPSYAFDQKQTSLVHGDGRTLVNNDVGSNRFVNCYQFLY